MPRGPEGFDEALRRAEAFAKLGADLTFIEAPKSELEMRRYCEIVPGHKTANMVEDGKTPWLRPEELREIGYSLVLYPLTLVLTNLAAMERAARSLRNGSVLEERAQFPGPPTHGRLRRLLEPGRRVMAPRPELPHDVTA